jgi:hypothetical protein
MSAFIALLVSIPGFVLSIFFMFIAALIGGGLLQWIFGGPYWLWVAIFTIIGLAYKPPVKNKST